MAVRRVERRHQRVATAGVFVGRLAVFALVAAAVMVAWVGLGTVVFKTTLDRADRVDAFRHASLPASGREAAPELRQANDAGRLAESAYSLLPGFVLLASAGVVAAPIALRLFHYFHVDDRLP